MIVVVDTREPWPHPWAVLLPQGWVLERASLETGASHPHGAVLERKTPSDMASCIGAGRERFERELKRGRYCRRMAVVVGSIAAWTLRFCPFVFAGSQRLAADFSWRLLASPLPSEERRRAQARRALPQEVSQPGALFSADAQSSDGAGLIDEPPF
jgi:hypothetical protein